VHRQSIDSFENGLGHATRPRVEAQYANEAQSEKNRAQQAITRGKCDDTWQCHGTTRTNCRCQRLTQATTRVARAATRALWASLVDNHMRERTKALSAPQSGPAKQLTSRVYHLSEVQACRIDCAEPLSGQNLRSADGIGALSLAVNVKFLGRAPASKCLSPSPGIFKMLCLDLDAIWAGLAAPSVLQ